jgi:hypothetical protein
VRCFLCLFAQYRAIEEHLAEAASARISAEDNARYWRARAEAAEEGRDKANGVVERCLKQVANFEALRSGSLNVPFPEAYPAPPEASHEDQEGRYVTGAGQRRTAREVQIESIERTRRSVVERRQQAEAAQTS